jgi:hypothetical protein
MTRDRPLARNWRCFPPLDGNGNDRSASIAGREGIRPPFRHPPENQRTLTGSRYTDRLLAWVATVWRAGTRLQPCFNAHPKVVVRGVGDGKKTRAGSSMPDTVPLEPSRSLRALVIDSDSHVPGVHCPDGCEWRQAPRSSVAFARCTRMMPGGSRIVRRRSRTGAMLFRTLMNLIYQVLGDGKTAPAARAVAER